MALVAASNTTSEPTQLVNPFYSPSTADDGDKDYRHAQFKVNNLGYFSRVSLNVVSAILP